MKIVKTIAHVCIQSADLARAEWFYCSVLGFDKRFVFKRGDKCIGFYLAIGKSNFIEVFEAPPAAYTPSRIRHFCLEVADINATYELLKRNGITVSEPKLGCDHTWQIWCKDPDDIDIEFHAYTAESCQKTGGVCNVTWT